MSKSYMTTKALAEIKRLNQAGKNDAEVADLLGISMCVARYWRRQEGLPPARHHRHAKEYAVYDGKTEELVALGTARECAAALNTTVNTFRTLISKAKRGAYKKYSFCEVERDVDDHC